MSLMIAGTNGVVNPEIPQNETIEPNANAKASGNSGPEIHKEVQSPLIKNLMVIGLVYLVYVYYKKGALL